MAIQPTLERASCRALRSQAPVRWTANGVLQGEGLIADGRRNVWICQLGRSAVDGAFDEWTTRIADALLSFDDLYAYLDQRSIGAKNRVSLRQGHRPDYVPDGLTIKRSALK